MKEKLLLKLEKEYWNNTKNKHMAQQEDHNGEANEMVVNTYEVWTEGYAATGESSGAYFHGRFKGNTFKDAVKDFVKTLSAGSQKDFSEERMCLWGCRFFDNERDARNSFG